MKNVFRLVLSLVFLHASVCAAYDPNHDGDPLINDIDEDGDRNLGTTFEIGVLGLGNKRATIAYTPDALNTFTISEGRIVDVTDMGDVGINAIETAGNNDTQAFQIAITAVLTTLYSNCTGGSTGSCEMDPANPGGDNNYIIYVPDGVYEIDDTLTYKTSWLGTGGNKPLRINGVELGDLCLTTTALLHTTDLNNTVVESCAGAPTTTYSEAIARIRIIGQSRDGVTIKAIGSSWSGKPMLSFGHVASEYNSAVSMNTLRNITIDANGTGATGLQFSGANNAGIHNIKIIGGINNVSAPDSGIYIKSAATQGYHSDIVIDGFARGINSTVYHATQSAFEHVTINGPGRAIWVQHSGLSLRKLLINKSTNVPFPVNLIGAGQIVLLDSTIKKSSGSPYFDTLDKVFSISSSLAPGFGHIHTRGIRLETNDINGDCSNVENGNSQSAVMNCVGRETLALLPMNPAKYQYTNLTPYVFSGTTDLELTNILATIKNNGGIDSLLIFPDPTYTFSQQHVVPSNLKLINFLYGSVTAGSNYLFTVNESSPSSLIIEDITSAGKLFEHAGGYTRPLILRHVGGTGSPYRNESGVLQNVSFESVNALGKADANGPIKSFFNVNAWARGINTEYPFATNFPVDGGSAVWVMGYKTEKNQLAFSLSHDNDMLEVLGGFTNQRGSVFSATDKLLQVNNSNAKASFIGFTSGIGVGGCARSSTSTEHFSVITQEIGSTLLQTTWPDYPPRGIDALYCNDIFIPLFTTDNDNDGLTNGQESILGANPLNRLDPPRVNFSRNVLVGLDDVDYENPTDARYSSWISDTGLFNGSGPIDKKINSFFVPAYTYGCAHIDGFVSCGEGQELNNVAKVEAGGEDSCALLTTGELKCWNRDIVTAAVTPSPVSGLNYNPVRDFSVHLGANSGIACAIGDSSSYVCWQNFVHPYTTDVTGAYTNPTTPTLTNLTAVAVGSNHVCFIDSGKVHCKKTSSGNAALLGPDTDNNGFIDGITDARKIVAGDNFTCLLRGAYETGSGSVTCWGNGAPTISPAPNKPVSITAMGDDVCVIEAGSSNISNALKCFPVIDMDQDDDGFPDPDDAMPFDTDNDGVPNVSDAFPLNPAESVDTDGDGVGNNTDSNDDNDCYLDANDPTPLVSGTTKAGDLDCTFDYDGKATTGIGAGLDQAYASLVQSNGKVVVVGYANVSGTDNDFAIVRYKSDGTLDTSFDGDGKATTAFLTTGSGTKDDRAYAVIQQSNGKLVVAGYSNQSTTTTADNNFALVRYNHDGSLDTSFGTGGKVTTAMLTTGSKDDQVLAITENKITVLSYTSVNPSVFTTSGLHGLVANAPVIFTATTMPNPLVAGTTYYVKTVPTTTTFTVSTTSGGTAIQVSAGGIGLVATDGKLVAAGIACAAGTAPACSDVNFALARYTSAGVLDTTFNLTGKVTTAVLTTGNKLDQANALIQQADGKLVVAGSACAAGTASSCTNVNVALVRYARAGGLDTTFNTTGKVTTAVSTTGSLSDVANAVKQQSDGKLVVVGTSNTSTGDDFSVVRYTPAGALDTTFNTTGKLTLAIGSTTAADRAHGLVIQPDSKLVVAGVSSNGADDDVAIIRLNSGGSLDTSFMVTGKVTTPVGAGNDVGRALVLQPDGNFLVGGYSSNGTNDDFSVLRYFGATAN